MGLKHKAAGLLASIGLLAGTLTQPALAADEIVLKNQHDMTWERMLPELGADSPIYTILRIDPSTKAYTEMPFPPTQLGGRGSPAAFKITFKKTGKERTEKGFVSASARPAGRRSRRPG